MTSLPTLYRGLGRNFGLLWCGQLVSFLGDRLHQVAVGVLVLGDTGSPLLAALAFAAATLPNLFFAPLAGALVDRWPHRRTLIATDLARAGLVLAVPLALSLHVVLVYLIAFAVAMLGMLFRPAKNAVLPLIVPPGRLLDANGAMIASETAADLLGYPVAGLLLTLLGPLLWLAFVADALSYLLSALAITAMRIPLVARLGEELPDLIGEMRAGWRFLREEPALWANTALAIFAQLAVGAEIALSLPFAQRELGRAIGYPTNYALLMAAIGAGSLLGVAGVGYMAGRIGKGSLTALGYMVFGLTLLPLAIVRDPFLAIVVYAGAGVANMLFVIPSMTLFGERVPAGLMGRVGAIRMALVFGTMTAAIVAFGALAEVFSPGLLLGAAGAWVLTIGVLGWLWPAVRRTA